MRQHHNKHSGDLLAAPSCSIAVPIACDCSCHWRILHFAKFVSRLASRIRAAIATPRYGGPKPGVAAGHALARGVDAALRVRLEAFFTPFNKKLKRMTGVGWTYAV